MQAIHGITRGLFALASAGLGLLILATGHFAPGEQSLPDWISWRTAGTQDCAFLLLVASVGMLFFRTAVASVVVVGAYILIWLLLGVPAILAHPLTIGGWYGFCEALTSLVGAWILYAMLREESRDPGMPSARQPYFRTAQVLFGLTCIFYGVSHFAYADYTAGMVPTWLPRRLGLAYLTGICHIAAGVAIAFAIAARLAAILEALMMSLFGLLVWLPTFFMSPAPKWAMPAENQWSEVVVNIVLAVSAWTLASCLGQRAAPLRAVTPPLPSTNV